LVAACSSSRPSNALPATLRAQSAAAALAASLDVLSRFIAASPQSSRPEAEYEENLRVVATPIQAALPEPVRPAPSIPTPMSVAPTPVITPTDFETLQAEAIQSKPVHAEPIHAELIHAQSQQMDTGTSEQIFESPVDHIEPPQIEEPTEHSAPPVFDMTPPRVHEPEPVHPVMAAQHDDAPHIEAPVLTDYTPATSQASHSESTAAESAGVFDLHSLSAEEQEMHRRANRVAKVSMQDIQLLKPDQVILGRENHDLCMRLNEEIGKARKEYERRFGPILGHGVDYFYHWMVEVLAAGDPEALGEYPYSTPALRH
jgi:hypothetical protein